jgi:hypothetical protein
VSLHNDAIEFGTKGPVGLKQSTNKDIRDAALQALGVVRGQHQGVLGRSEYEFYAQQFGGSLVHTFPTTNRVADARLIYYCSFP